MAGAQGCVGIVSRCQARALVLTGQGFRNTGPAPPEGRLPLRVGAASMHSGQGGTAGPGWGSHLHAPLPRPRPPNLLTGGWGMYMRDMMCELPSFRPPLGPWALPCLLGSGTQPGAPRSLPGTEWRPPPRDLQAPQLRKRWLIMGEYEMKQQPSHSGRPRPFWIITPPPTLLLPTPEWLPGPSFPSPGCCVAAPHPDTGLEPACWG